VKKILPTQELVPFTIFKFSEHLNEPFEVRYIKKSSHRKLTVVVSNAQKLPGKYHKLTNNDVKYRD